MSSRSSARASPTENYGIGLKKGDTAGTAAINAAIAKMIADGSWKTALEDTVGAVRLHDPGPADPQQLIDRANGPRDARLGGRSLVVAVGTAQSID